MKMTYITIYTETMDTIDELDDDSAGRLLKGLLHYANGDDVMLVGDERIAFKFMSKAMDEHYRRYKETCDKNRANINARWQKYHEQQVQTNTLVYDGIQSNDLVLKDKDKDEIKVKDKDISKAKRFTPPTLEEVQAYCSERGNKVDAERWFDFYSAKGWKIGSNSMKDWKAAVRTWEKNGTSQSQKVQVQKVMPAAQYEQREYEASTELPDWMKEALKKMK